ncbi:MAG: family transposase, partial [Actinomycetota bacterium]|nr:family transposase [Actinomycetota bacterium]
TGDFGRVIAGVAAQLRDVHAERAALATDLETRLEAHPALSLVLAT